MWNPPQGWHEAFTILGYLTPWAVWIAWWLWGVNWKKAWPVLAAGGWAPLVLMMAVATLVWSRIDPVDPAWNVWWQLGIVCGLVALALFCGWLQGQFGWAPEEIDLEPPPVAAGHDHGHH